MKKISLEKLASLEKARPRSDSTGGEKLPSQIVSEMKKHGISDHLCNFILQSFHSLQHAKGYDKPLAGDKMSSYIKCLKDLKDPKDLTVLLLSMEHALKTLKGYTMRFNQIAALLLLMFDSEEKVKGRLLEVATGEGKSCVIACFAAVQALSGKKVDIVCSSPILAKRDEQEWRPFFERFGLSCGSLPAKNNSDLRQVYKRDIVYATVNDFSADVLKEEFDGEPTRVDRGFDSLIVDEVDHLTLDSCLSMTYLSHQAPGMHHLSTVFAVIWQMVTAIVPLSEETKAFTKRPQFFTGFLATLLQANEGEEISELDVLALLVEKEFISEGDYREVVKQLEGLKVDEKDENANVSLLSNGVKAFQDLVLERVRQLNPDVEPEDGIAEIFKCLGIQTNSFMLDGDNNLEMVEESKESDNKIIIFPNGHVSVLYEDQEAVAKAIRKEALPMLDNISIPSFLRGFVEKMLPRFIENAIHVAYGCELGSSYQIASGDSSEDANMTSGDAIIPVDVTSTGILEKNKRYSEGVQQFLEMKHKLSVSDVTMTTNFLSNFMFYSRYKQIHGLSGTLGNQFDKDFLRERLGLVCVSVPSHKPSLTQERGFKVRPEERWMDETRLDVESVVAKGQVVLVICSDMNKAEMVHDLLKERPSQGQEPIRYWRDDIHRLPDSALNPKDVVISTALASRGTDIRLTELVNQNGGLHVLLTYLPKDSRTQRQIVGRTGRKGQPGSFSLILSQDELIDFNTEKKDEIEARRDAIEANRVDGLKSYLDVIIFQEDLFRIFSSELKYFSAENFSILEQRKDFADLSTPLMKKLLEKMAGKQFDFKPATDALKESWAIWYCQKQKEIQQAALDGSEKKDEIRDELKVKIKEDILKLTSGRWENFYHYIVHAMGRSLLHETNPKVFGLDFVISAWSGIDGKVAKDKDKRYISSVHYNLACFLLRQDAEGNSKRALDLLKKAKTAFAERMQDFLVDAKLKQSINSIGKSHVEVSKSETAPNLVLQSDSSGIILENFLKNTTEMISVLENRNEDTELKVEDKDVRDLFDAGQDPILSAEISQFASDGHYQCFDVKEEPKKNHWGGFWCFLLGVGQVIGGLALCAFSAGLASSIGLNLIFEGISDCVEGFKGMITGTFSWVQWAIGKAISLAVSVLSFGVGKACKWFKTGGSLFKNCTSKVVSGFTTQGAKQSLKQALKYTAKQMAVQGAVALMDKGVEKLIEQATKEVAAKYKDEFRRSILENSNLREAIHKAVLARAEMRIEHGFEITKHVLDSIKQEVHF